MKIQITRFSSHQTAKVFAIILALSSLLFMIPFSLMTMMMPSPVAPDGTPISMGFPIAIFIFMPIMQGIFGYFMIRFGAWIYNKLYPKIGGIEFEFENKE